MGEDFLMEREARRKGDTASVLVATEGERCEDEGERCEDEEEDRTTEEKDVLFAWLSSERRRRE